MGFVAFGGCNSCSSSSTPMVNLPTMVNPNLGYLALPINDATFEGPAPKPSSRLYEGGESIERKTDGWTRVLMSIFCFAVAFTLGVVSTFIVAPSRHLEPVEGTVPQGIIAYQT